MIDIHAHISSDKLFPKEFINGITDSLIAVLPTEEKNASILNLLNRITLNMLSDHDCSKLIKQADNAGITKTVLLIIDFFYNPVDQDSSYIEWVHKFHYDILKSQPEKFIVFSGIDPRRGKKGLDLLEKAIKDYGFKGLKLYPPCGFELDDKELYPFYELCGYYKIPVLIHTGPSLSYMKTPINYPDSILKATEEFKEVNFILGHAGILYFDEGIEIAQKRKNLFLDISGFQKELSQLEQLNKKFTQLFEKVPEKVLFGSDWPLFHMNTTQANIVFRLKQLSIMTDKNQELLFIKNPNYIIP